MCGILYLVVGKANSPYRSALPQHFTTELQLTNKPIRSGLQDLREEQGILVPVSLSNKSDCHAESYR